MSIMFNILLKECGVTPADVILVRHQDQRADKGRTPYELWREAPEAFEAYQAIQSTSQRSRFDGAQYWAVFVGTPAGETVFVNLYAAVYQGLLDQDLPRPHNDGIDQAGTRDRYALTVDPRLSKYAGKLLIEWGEGTRAWVQRAERQDKPIVELRPRVSELPFPGFLKFQRPLSQLASVPQNWIDALKAAKGVYVLVCPQTNRHYVGQADGAEGFWQRWQDYRRNGHGGTVALKAEDRTDYLVSILEVARTPPEPGELHEMEQRWMRKLCSRDVA
jgi:hypothetical protein